MPLDGLALHAVCQELNEKLCEARIDRIFQPHQLTLTIDLRQRGIVRKLLISAHPQYARLQLSQQKRSNPQVPPLFCQYLRKTLEGARIEKLVQPGYERLIEMHLLGRDELGNPAKYLMMIELMGKHSNIILTDESGRILEAIKHVGHSQSRVREVLPGLSYRTPPRQEKLPPEQWQAPREENDIPEGDLEILAWMGKRLDGLGPGTVRALLYQCKIPENLRARYLRLDDWMLLQASLFDLLQSRQEGKLYLHGLSSAVEIGAFKLPGQPEGSWQDASEALEAYFGHRENTQLLQQQRQRLYSIAHAAEEKGLRKKAALEDDLSSAQDCEHLRIWGELLKMAPEPSRRIPEIELVNYYDEHLAEVVIPLDHRLTISENAQSFFKRYSKYRIGEKLIADQLSQLQKELDYLATVILAIEQAVTLDDLKEITTEMTEQGYIAPERTRGKAKPKVNAALPLVLTIEGVEVLIGRNNRQNDELTWKLAHSDDTWLHAKDIPGSHLLIRSATPSNSLLTKAARLAAWYSKARESGLVPVDITLRRHIKKPKGAKPGYVIYGNQRTVYITPMSPDELNEAEVNPSETD